MATLPMEVIAELQQNNPGVYKALAKDPDYKDVILAFEKEASKEDIEFSNLESFEIEGFGTLTLAGLCMVATSRMPRENAWEGVNKKSGVAYNYPATPKLYALNSPVWTALERIQRGKVAQGLEFSLDYKALATTVESLLA